jgi:C-terminal processing protease CtpA/Prc
VYYYPPSGELIHGIGITPDVVVDNTEDEDLQFLRAIEELKALSESANP